MIRAPLLHCLLCGAIAISSGCGAAPDESANVDEKLTMALSQRSGIAESELKRLLANCDQDQQTLYVCSYRDLVREDMALAVLVAGKVQAHSACADTIKRDLESWRRSSLQSCARTAESEWGQGSMKSTAENECMTEATQVMIAKVRQLDGCGAVTSLLETSSP